MELHEKILWLLLGVAIGFIAGYFVRAVRDIHDIKEELHEVDTIVKRKWQSRDEKGIVRYPLVADVILLLVVGMVVWASFQTSKVNDQVKDTQAQQAKQSSCVQKYLDETIVALNERTTFTVDQALSNVELLRSQSKFLALVLARPPASEERIVAVLESYFNNVNEFVVLSTQTAQKAEQNPYPTPEQLEGCLDAS